MSVRRFMAACLLVMGCGASAVQASVVIGATRVIYPADQKEVTVSLANQGKQPVLAQVWVDTGDPLETPDAIKAPFFIRPPMFRMEPNSGHAVRLTYTGDPLPDNQETMFWFNVLEVPPKAANGASVNQVQFATRTRIKLIFRPLGLQGNPNDAFKQLSWKWVTGEGGQGFALEVTNPTPYYVNFADVGLKVDGVLKRNDDGGMVAPGATATFSLAPLQLTSRPSGDVRASFDVIDDAGGSSAQEAPLVP
ncbi:MULTISPECIES: molecular chaperone [Ralstonia]|jgi:chaperone protein EcpD|uniref:Fimbrial chaperone YadV n=1 Tax=Ralstonia flaminis TaxID=3058597 RepID=A0ABN9JW94_9RALS|nr:MULTISPECIES: fimbria/pilus periplasmic chaperone [unclassified Ralstonia]CAJ0822643.1 putative fimbrial chaperone YadV [Ralstonia sp. LMG 18101]